MEYLSDKSSVARMDKNLEKISPFELKNQIDATRSHSDLIKYPDTDWTDYMYQTGMIQSH